MFDVSEQMDAKSHSVVGKNSEVKGEDDNGSAESPLDEDDQMFNDNEGSAHPINTGRFTYFDDTADEMTSISVMSGVGPVRQRSPVWKYFVYRRLSGICKLCRKSVKRAHGSTTSLLTHLRWAHRKQYRAITDEYSRRKVEAEARDEVLCWS